MDIRCYKTTTNESNNNEKKEHNVKPSKGREPMANHQLFIISQWMIDTDAPINPVLIGWYKELILEC